MRGLLENVTPVQNPSNFVTNSASTFWIPRLSAEKRIVIRAPWTVFLSLIGFHANTILFEDSKMLESLLRASASSQ